MNITYSSEQLAWLIRRHSIEMVHLSGGSHIGSILSVADIIAVLYAAVMNYDALNPKSDKRDRIILSKGHAGAALYSALAESGFFSAEELVPHYQNGSRLSGHVSHHIPGVDFSTGSLGHGLSVAVGMAMAGKMDNKAVKVYVICGDGECDEGTIWEAALAAHHYKLNNLITVIDHNKMQSLDFCENTISLAPFLDKWKSFGWNVIEVDGHNHIELKKSFLEAAESFDRPSVIVANTIKGCGISYMENNILWHYRYPHDGWEYNMAVEELNAKKPVGITDPYNHEIGI